MTCGAPTSHSLLLEQVCNQSVLNTARSAIDTAMPAADPDPNTASVLWYDVKILAATFNTLPVSQECNDSALHCWPNVYQRFFVVSSKWEPSCERYGYY
jgi:hypothetical protein